MVILGSQIKNTDFFMILAWLSRVKREKLRHVEIAVIGTEICFL